MKLGDIRRVLSRCILVLGLGLALGMLGGFSPRVHRTGTSTIGSSPFRASQTNYALQFNGHPDFVVIPHSPTTNLGQDLTIELQVRTTASYGGTRWHDAQWLLDKDITYRVNPDWAVVVRYGKVVFNNGNPSGVDDQPLFGNSAINDGSWHHIAITRDTSSGHTTLYIDGEKDAEGFFATHDLANTLPLYIGAEDGIEDSFERAFRGALDELRLWNVARSQAEIQSSMWASLKGNEEGLVCYWRFNEGVGQAAFDATSGHNDGQLGSLEGQDDNDPTWIFTPWFSVSGHVRDAIGNPMRDVMISNGASNATTTDADGYYSITGLPAGQYVLRATKPAYVFAPDAITIQLNADKPGVNFRGQAIACAVPVSEPFLQFPLAGYRTAQTFGTADDDTWDGGLLNSWFDHETPSYTPADSLIRLYTTEDYPTNPDREMWGGLCCGDKYCYDNHDGYDIVRPDESVAHPTIYAAADGTVVAVCSNKPTTCWPLGNQVWVDHGNNYATVYAHLDTVSVSVGNQVTADTPLGTMGETGNSDGIHLHFGVYFNRNLRDPWIISITSARRDEVVDPFGWDGWEKTPVIPDTWNTPSVNLWVHAPRVASLMDSSGGRLASPSGRVIADIPAGALDDLTLMTLHEVPVSAPSATLRSVGSGFSLWALWDWITRDSTREHQTEEVGLTEPITVNVSYADATLAHLDTLELAIKRFDEANESWQTLSTTLDSAAQTATAQIDQLGVFDLQAPLLCPEDTLEPNDRYATATKLASQYPIRTLFDIPDDEDWFQLEAEAGSIYKVDPFVKTTKWPK